MNAIVKLEGVVEYAGNPHMQRLVNMVLDTVAERSQRDYGRALNDFLAWYTSTGQDVLNKACVMNHVQALKARGVTDSSINQRLAAIRKLAMEAADNGLIPEGTAQAIKRVENIKVQGHKLGNWLTQAQASQMVCAPDTQTLKGKRDRAVLALMLGCGLRREEVSNLAVNHLAQREGRWVILDMCGKHNRTRTVPMGAWVKAAIDQWLAEAEIKDGFVFRRVRRHGCLTGEPLSSTAIWDIVQQYAPVPDLAPHDLRRTFAKLASKAGAPLDQIQRSLGHASIQTTELYIGFDLDLAHAPSDYITLDI